MHHFELFNHLKGLKQNGTNRYISLCPLHGEKTPSFHITVNTDGSLKIICYGCGCNGLDVYRHFKLEFDELFGRPKRALSNRGRKKRVITKSIADRYNYIIMFHAIYEAATERCEEDRNLYKCTIAELKRLKEEFPKLK